MDPTKRIDKYHKNKTKTAKGVLKLRGW